MQEGTPGAPLHTHAGAAQGLCPEGTPGSPTPHPCGRSTGSVSRRDNRGPTPHTRGAHAHTHKQGSREIPRPVGRGLTGGAPGQYLKRSCLATGGRFSQQRSTKPRPQNRPPSQAGCQLAAGTWHLCDLLSLCLPAPAPSAPLAVSNPARQPAAPPCLPAHTLAFLPAAIRPIQPRGASSPAPGQPLLGPHTGQSLCYPLGRMAANSLTQPRTHAQPEHPKGRNVRGTQGEGDGGAGDPQ